VRRVAVAAMVAALAVLAAGCGGSKIAADEVPGSPVALTTQMDRQAPEGARPDSSSTSSSDTDTDADSGDTSTSDQSGTDSGGDTGAAATPAPAETPAPDAGGGTQDQTQQGTAPAEPAPQGSDEQRFEEFCDQNAGAC
jgi:negative regulator of sigma E activity